PTTTPPTTTPPGGACGGLAAWSASAVYTAGNQVSYQGQKWQAKWWTQNEPPKTADGYPWQLLGNC
ncbi:MAG: carbohydrate-binding protein, partial [Renibacterium salmoninarum]|nr:carbohydrate-binding protein [Renibacterium salmoninarum]